MTASPPRAVVAARALVARLRVARALARAAATAESAADVVEAAFSAAADGTPLAPVQVPSELAAFAEAVRAERPQRVLEIGTSNGGTLYVLAWASAPAGRVVSVDMNRFHSSRRWLYHSFGGRRRRVQLVCGDSHAPETRDRIAEALGHEPVDVLLIDGDHSYDGVKRDFELYTPLVRPGGIVALHDIVDGPGSAVGGVPAFWREARSSLTDVRELVESPTQGGYGIGLGRIPEGSARP